MYFTWIKPVVFFQFDREKYEEAHGSYLDMSKELFGECADNVDGLLTYMEELQPVHFVTNPSTMLCALTSTNILTIRTAGESAMPLWKNGAKKKEEEKADEPGITAGQGAAEGLGKPAKLVTAEECKATANVVGIELLL